MLYWLLYQKLFPYFRPFRIFRFLTFRTAFATLTAMLIALVVGPYVIEKLREFQISQYIREEGPEGASEKGGHADDGRRPDLRFDPVADAAVERPLQSFCLDGHAVNSWLTGPLVLSMTTSRWLTAAISALLQAKMGLQILVAVAISLSGHARAAGQLFDAPGCPVLQTLPPRPGYRRF